MPLIPKTPNDNPIATRNGKLLYDAVRYERSIKKHFKNSGGKCAVTGAPLKSIDSAKVVNENPLTFSLLKDAFLIVNGLTESSPITIRGEKKSNGYYKYELMPKYKALWLDFYRKHAKHIVVAKTVDYVPSSGYKPAQLKALLQAAGYTQAPTPAPSPAPSLASPSPGSIYPSDPDKKITNQNIRAFLNYGLSSLFEDISSRFFAEEFGQVCPISSLPIDIHTYQVIFKAPQDCMHMLVAFCTINNIKLDSTCISESRFSKNGREYRVLKTNVKQKWLRFCMNHCEFQVVHPSVDYRADDQEAAKAIRAQLVEKLTKGRN